MRSALLFSLAAAAVRGSAAAPVAGYVVADATAPHGVRYVAGPPGSGALAWAAYDAAAMQTTGWATLDLHTAADNLNDTATSYAAGYLEGYLTAVEMDQFASNTGGDAPNGKKLQAFLDTNWAWMAGQVATNGSAYWVHVGALMAQVRGLADGQGAAPGPQRKLGFTVVYNVIIQGGDIFNLGQVYGVSAEQVRRSSALRRLAAARRVAVEGGDDAAARAVPGRADHCSALVRMTPDGRDILIGHTTWSALENMQRIVKRFDMPLPGAQGGAPVPGRYVATSSYPGYAMYSSDDFYVMSSGIVSQETTIDNDNITLAREFASTSVVLEWARNVLANRLAVDGRSWVATFSAHASGTYTNQWMVLDTNVFTPGAPLAPDTLLVLEEMPGHISVIDRTPSLTSPGFWSSYNVASDPAIFAISGQQALVDEYGGPTGPGAFFTWANTSRARIFARDAPGVADDAGFRRVIRYNDAPHDPLSTLGCGSAPPYSYTNAIADRSDLNDKRGDYVIDELGHGDSGAIDAKYTRASWMQAPGVKGGALPLAAVSGPTNDDVPTFAWSNATVKADHVGLPDVYDFAWIRQPW